MEVSREEFPGDGLPPMPGVKLPDGEEPGKAPAFDDVPGPVGETIGLGDLIPPEGLPVPEFREGDGAEAEAEPEAAEPEVLPEGKHNTFTRILYVFLQFTWGILQNICGFFTWALVRLRNPGSSMGTFHGAVMTRWRKSHSMGLGMFIFFGHTGAPDAANIRSHEYGHTVQSAWLGPLFLPVIGIPSYLWAFLPGCVKKRKEEGVKYCSFYPESWANSLGERITGIPGPDR